jgi:multiple antibiotic resistance protein
MTTFFRSTALILVLLNPFLVIIYLIDVVQKLEFGRFCKVLIRAAAFSLIVFWCFALLGDRVFSEIVQAEFASFEIFGGLIFLIIGIRFVFQGNTTIEILRGESKNLASAIAMPILIGPGTISASVIVGERHDALPACAAILLGVFLSVVIMLVLKRIHDHVRPRREPLVERYISIAGRIMALFVGTVSVQMIMQGVKAWIAKF